MTFFFLAILWLLGGIYNSLEAQSSPPFSEHLQVKGGALIEKCSFSSKPGNPSDLIAVYSPTEQIMKFFALTDSDVGPRPNGEALEPLRFSFDIGLAKSFFGKSAAYVTAFQCFEEKLILGVFEPRIQKSQIWTLEWVNGKFTNPQTLVPDARGLIRDLKCASHSGCFVLNESLFKFDLKEPTDWKSMPLPQSQKIQPSKLSPHLNPFANSSELYLLGQSRYTRMVIRASQLYLLDSRRAKIVILDLNNQNLDKWGEWGAHAGRMIYPKDVELEEDKLLVLDTGMKKVLRYSLTGDFQGYFELAPLEPSYPLAFVKRGLSFFVVDYIKNVLSVFTPEWVSAEALSASIPLTIHQKIFSKKGSKMRFHLANCLNCHDGTESYSLHRFSNFGEHHPVNVKMNPSKELKLPLFQAQYVTCTTCHDPHHQDVGKSQAPRHHYNLRMDAASLCSQCHQNQYNPLNNHFDLKKNAAKKAVSSCLDCHDKMHNTSPHLLQKESPRLCLDCHKHQIQVKASSNKPLAHLASHPLLDEQVQCLDCHQTHGGIAHQRFARANACFNCHELWQGRQLTNSHFDSTKMPQQTRWEPHSALCLNCHNPHQSASEPGKLCLECHKKQPSVHHGFNPFKTTSRTEGLRFFDDRITCITCHEPHGFDTQKKLVRSNPQLERFCATCHGDDTRKLLTDYHSLSSRTRAPRKKP